MKEEKKDVPEFVVTDPKPPVIRSGHLENRRQKGSGNRSL